MPVSFLPAFQGFSINTGGTRVASVKAIGTNPVDITKPELFSGMQVQYFGTQFIPLDEAIEMGIMGFDNVTQTLFECNGINAAPIPN